MSSSFHNLWGEVILAQIWMVRQTAAILARSIDAELLCDPQAMTDYFLNPSAKRLNPLEFHGKRRARPAQHPPSGKPEGDTASHAQRGQTRRLSASYTGVDRLGRRES